MDTKTLIDLMLDDNQIARFFRGVFPRNFLPRKLRKDSLYVINLSASNSKDNGSHWVLLSTLEAPRYSSYICSMGKKPTHKNVLDSLFSLSDTVIYNDFKNQGDFATTCGLHVIFCAAMLSRGHSLLKIMTEFYRNSTYINDRAVTEIITSCFDIKTRIPINNWDFIFRKSNNKKKRRKKAGEKKI